LNPGCAVVVMAKAPVAGYAKTRLAPTMGASGAAALAERMLDRTVEAALQARLGMVELCCAPDASHPSFARHAAHGRLVLSVQSDGDLGRRMACALAPHLSGGGRALLVGTDAPALDAAMLVRAASALDDADAVFVPTLDGGYALVGLREPQPTLFDGMRWSVASVMQQTRARARRAGLSVVELAPVADIDEPADLAHLPQGWMTGGGGPDDRA
jgi:uncharacterized protein